MSVPVANEKTRLLTQTYSWYGEKPEPTHEEVVR